MSARLPPHQSTLDDRLSLLLISLCSKFTDNIVLFYERKFRNLFESHQYIDHYSRSNLQHSIQRLLVLDRSRPPC